MQITANYLGGNAQDLEKTVAQPIEEQLVGLDGMLYFLSTSANNGQLTINVTFKLGTNPDIAAVQTQNSVNVALPRLPPEVQRQGVIVKKVSTAFLMAVGLVSSDDRYDSLFLTNYAQINLVNQIGSLPGVGESRLSSQQVYSHARLAESGQDDEARDHRDRCQQRRSRRRTGRIRRARSDRRPRRAAPISNMR